MAKTMMSRTAPVSATDAALAPKKKKIRKRNAFRRKSVFHTPLENMRKSVLGKHHISKEARRTLEDVMRRLVVELGDNLGTVHDVKLAQGKPRGLMARDVRSALNIMPISAERRDLILKRVKLACITFNKNARPAKVAQKAAAAVV